jgi:hypothetical protein
MIHCDNGDVDKSKAGGGSKLGMISVMRPEERALGLIADKDHR